VVHRFHYLRLGLAAVLVFVGGKMLAADFYTVPIGVSLAIIVSVLGVAIAASMFFPEQKAGPDEPHGRAANPQSSEEVLE
jgi:tellurite resistance protein TerC